MFSAAVGPAASQSNVLQTIIKFIGWKKFPETRQKNNNCTAATNV